MIPNIKLYLLLLILIGGSGCKYSSEESKKTITKENLFTYPFEINLINSIEQEDKLLLSKEFSKIEYILLETTKELTLKQIDGILKTNEEFIIYNYESSKSFTNKGKYIKEISRQGEGPGDFYMIISDMFQNNRNQDFYLLDLVKTIHFNQNGEFLNSFKSPKGGKAIFHENEIIQYISNPALKRGDTTLQYSLQRMDLEGKELFKYKNNAPRYLNGKGITTNIGLFHEYNKDIYFNDFFNGNDSIFIIRKDFLEHYATIELGKWRIDPNPDMSLINNISDFREFKKQRASFLELRKIIEDKSNIYLLLEWGERNGNVYMLYNKQKGHVKNLTYHKFVNDLDGGISFFPFVLLADGSYVMWIDAEEFKEEILSKDHIANRQKYGEKYESVYNLALSLKEDDNTVLVIARE